MKSGIYLFTNVVNGKDYVGSSSDLPDRREGHVTCLRGGYHRNDHLQKAWNKYGEDAFVHSVVEYCDQEDLLSREDWWMKLLDSRNPRRGYNKRTAERHQQHAETRAKISAAMSGSGNHRYGTSASLEHKAKISSALKGRPKAPFSAEHRARLAAAKKGKRLTPGHRASIAAAVTGHTTSPEARAKISAARKASGYTCT